MFNLIYDELLVLRPPYLVTNAWSKYLDEGLEVCGVFCGYLNTVILHQMYISYVRPLLEYACPVWRAYLKKDIDLLEKVQSFACKICLHWWSGFDYDVALSVLDVP